MTGTFMRPAIRALAITFAVNLAFGAVSRAQGTNPNLVPAGEQQQDQSQQLKVRQLNQAPAPALPRVDPAEEAAYTAFYGSNPQDPDTRIRIGEAFVQKYPVSRYAETVYAALTQAYSTKQDTKNFYTNADKALALNPNDASVLVIVGWMIPHDFKPESADALKNLDKAEHYEKRAMEIIPTLTKPVNITDAQFAQSESGLLSAAHSGLGLVYFRRQDPEDSVKELQQSVRLAARPDPTDLFVLGLGLQSLNRYAEAADAFSRCGQVPSSLQDRCKQSADAAKKAGK
ncbi:MAG TPA: tetratricopeptide repeat protein [Candidatus Acidoferrales bacterium]|nr:tetratricopeptide repeat protein [Candidatus Acidoferrales bacterium]